RTRRRMRHRRGNGLCVRRPRRASPASPPMSPAPRSFRRRVTTAPVRALACLAATLLAAPATAQLTDDDRGKLLAARRQGNSYLLETLLKTLPLGPSIDALSADHELRDTARETLGQQI